MIYLDYAATTPCDAVVIQEMLPYYAEIFGNPNSLHKFGMDAKDALDIARNRIAQAINSNFDEIIQKNVELDVSIDFDKQQMYGKVITEYEIINPSTNSLSLFPSE